MEKYEKNQLNERNSYKPLYEKDDLNIKEYMVVAISLCVIHFFMEFMYLYLGCTPMVIVNIFSVLSYIISIILLTKGYSMAPVWIMEGEIFLHVILVCIFLGGHCGFQFWLYGIFSSVFMPFFVPNLSKTPRKQIGGFVFCLIVAFEIITYLENHRLLPTTYRISDDLAMVMYYINAAIGFGAILVYVAIYNRIMTARNRNLQEVADHDGLTGIFNRQKMQNVLDKEVERENELSEEKLAVAILDVDYFKKINDTYGHQVGDDVLKVLANILSSDKYEGMQYGRWGGEEFFLISPQGISYEAFGEMLESLRLEIQNHAISSAGQDVKITVSIGAARFELGMSEKALVKAADERLYIAKESGRNRVVCL